MDENPLDGVYKGARLAALVLLALFLPAACGSMDQAADALQQIARKDCAL